MGSTDPTDQPRRATPRLRRYHRCSAIQEAITAVQTHEEKIPGGDPVPMILTCPCCGERHVDKGDFATRPHTTHACQHCGMCWRPAVVATVGVQFLPGFKDLDT